MKSKTGIYVENLTEAFVCSTRDVIQLLKKVHTWFLSFIKYNFSNDSS